MNPACDIALIGSGVSSAYTLRHFLALLEGSRPARPVRIMVFEKSGEFWSGVPYGSTSGQASLLISPLAEFIPQEKERADFKAWLNDHRDRLTAPAATAGPLSARWQRGNAAAIAAGEWDHLYLPRQLFGCYLREKVTAALADATAQGLIECQLVAAGITDIERIGDIHRLTADTAESATVLATKVVLAVGSPPYAGIARPGASATTAFIDDMYEPSLEANIRRICANLRQSSRRQVLIIGSNASALETLYNLADSDEAMSLIEKIVMLSPDAAFPHRINREVPACTHRFTHLDALADLASPVSQDILTAVQKDVAAAAAQGLNIADLYADISRKMIATVCRLERSEQEKFVAFHGVEIGKLQRRAGPEYLDTAHRLIADGKLEIHAGRFVRLLPEAAGGPGFTYLEGRTGGPKVLTAPISVVVSCAGFQDVANSSSTLLQNLIRRGICAPNTSRRGIAINAEYEASPGCHVMGPLVAGNIIGKVKVWHAESCTRIIQLSQTLAEILARGLQPPVTAEKNQTAVC
jgi:uncharacterized NAD(P)/FAD-binding protein YdhS